jgi:hypothetical protein
MGKKFIIIKFNNLFLNKNILIKKKKIDYIKYKKKQKKKENRRIIIDD